MEKVIIFYLTKNQQNSESASFKTLKLELQMIQVSDLSPFMLACLFHVLGRLNSRSILAHLIVFESIKFFMLINPLISCKKEKYCSL